MAQNFINGILIPEDGEPRRVALETDGRGLMGDALSRLVGGCFDTLPIVALGFDPDSGASVSLTEEQAETVTEYFTETSPAGSGLLENLRLRLGLPSFAADPTDTSDPTGIATSSDVVTPSMKGL